VSILVSLFAKSGIVYLYGHGGDMVVHIQKTSTESGMVCLSGHGREAYASLQSIRRDRSGPPIGFRREKRKLLYSPSTESGIVHLSELGGEAQASIRGNCIAGNSLLIRTWREIPKLSKQSKPQSEVMSSCV